MALKFLTRFPSGNGRLISIEREENETVVSFAADPRGGPEALWFHFRLQETEPGSVPPEAKLRLVLRHVGNLLGGGDPAALIPVVRSRGQTWTRLRHGVPRLEPDGQMSATWAAKYPDPETDVAFCFPYGRDELETLVRKSGGYWNRDSIGVTTDGRPLLRLANGYGEPGARLPGVFLLARQHAGETPGSWVLDGLLEELSRQKARNLLVWTVPLADPEGIEEGAYGKDRYPWDLNRAWGIPPMRHEALAIKADLRRWADRCAPALALDLHAPGASDVDGLFTFLFSSEAAPGLLAESEKWANVLGGALAPAFAADRFKRQADYPSRWETPNFTRCVLEEFGVPALTLEIPYAEARGRILTQKAYRQAGKQLAVAIAQRLKSRVG